MVTRFGCTALMAFRNLLVHLSEHGEAEDLVLPKLLLHGADAEIVFGSKKNRVITARQQARVQPVLDMAEKIALGVQSQPAAQNEPHVRNQATVTIELHALGPVTDLKGVIPNPLIGIFTNVLALPVEHHGDQGLRNAQVPGNSLLRNAFFLLHSPKV